MVWQRQAGHASEVNAPVVSVLVSCRSCAAHLPSADAANLEVHGKVPGTYLSLRCGFLSR